MKFKNRKEIMSLIFAIILLASYIAYVEDRFQYKLFLIIIIIFSSIFYVFATFEYFKIDDDKISYISPLTSLRKEARWNEIKGIYVFRTGIFKVIKIRYGSLEEKEIIINSGVNNYKKLIKIVLNKIQDNESISIDRMIDEIIE